METPKRGRPRIRKGPRGKLADAIRAARAARGLSQEQAAVELGIGREHLARIESGSRKLSGLALRGIECWISHGTHKAGTEQ